MALYKINKSKRDRGREEERNKAIINKQKIINKMSIINPNLSIITVNINEITSQIKRHRVTEWKNDTRIDVIYKWLIEHLRTYILKMKGLKHIYSIPMETKRLIIFIIDTMDFKTNTVDTEKNII